MALLRQSTAYTRLFKLISSIDHISAKTGVTATVNLSKAGGTFGAAAGSVSEIANGWYQVSLTTVDTNTLGDLAYYITGSGADDTDFCDQVGVVPANVVQIAGSAPSATNIARTTQAISICAVGSASTTTSIVTSSMDPAAAATDQFKGRIVTFDRATTTANLRGQATDITGSSSSGVLTVTALTDAPVSGDTFTIT